MVKTIDLYAFIRQVTCSKVGIPAEVRDQALKILQDLAYAASEEEYWRIREKLDVPRFKEVHDYLQKNWDSSREEWVSLLFAVQGWSLVTSVGFPTACRPG